MVGQVFQSGILPGFGKRGVGQRMDQLHRVADVPLVCSQGSLGIAIQDGLGNGTMIFQGRRG
jgi:hypothetical protein